MRRLNRQATRGGKRKKDEGVGQKEDDDDDDDGYPQRSGAHPCRVCAAQLEWRS